jgi:hypothetical protein
LIELTPEAPKDKEDDDDSDIQRAKPTEPAEYLYDIYFKPEEISKITK